MKLLDYTIKLGEIYPKGFTIPPGYRVVGFRPPLKGESYITRTQPSYEPANIYNMCESSDFMAGCVRIVIEPIPRRFAQLEVELPEGRNPGELIVYTNPGSKRLIVNKFSVIEK